ncbi:MAG: phosphate/phosphite/phosphonate ABC transporter substrate-binding protein [Candidatus Methylomirabilales bacterium]
MRGPFAPCLSAVLPAVAIALTFAAPAAHADPASRRPAAALRIAVAAMMSPAETVAAYRELVEYIGEGLGRPVQFKQRRTYQEVNDMLGTGEVDLAFLCSGAYVHAQRQYGVKLLAVPLMHGSPFYRSYMIVSADSGVKSVLDLRGKRFAYTDRLSATGYLYPVYAVLQAGGYPTTYFAGTMFTRGHDNSIEAVAEGIADAAGVHSAVYDRLETGGSPLIPRTRIIQRSPPFGSPPVVVPRSLDRGLKTALRTLLLGMSDDPRGRSILGKLEIERFVRGDPGLYGGVRDMLQVVEGATTR